MTDAVTARVAAELDIRNVIMRIARLADQGHLDEYLDQFTEDSVWDFPGAPRHGRDDIRAGAEARRADGVTGPGSATRHVITNVSVHLHGPDRAVADSYFVFLQHTTTAPTIFNMGAYHDSFVREGQSWRLARREITFG
ncbi:MAG: nuclear transport factor 2 family protein [Acidimicrobiales bacterium]